MCFKRGGGRDVDGFDGIGLRQAYELLRQRLIEIRARIATLSVTPMKLPPSGRFPP